MENTTTLDSIKFSIIIATYYRNNGSTKSYVERSIESILNQKYTNWMIYLIGDEYTNSEEFESFSKLVDKDKIKMFNKPDPERKYITDKRKLWKIAGASAMNYGLNWARKDGFKYTAHLDDDDYWNDNHLGLLSEVYTENPNCVFAFTKSTYPYQPKYLPIENITSAFPNNLLPRHSNIVHSSISFRCDILTLELFTTHTEAEIRLPSDAMMLEQIREFINKHPEWCSIYIPVLTCHHDEEGT